MMDDLTIERKLSPSEKLWWILDQECRGNFVMHARAGAYLTFGGLTFSTIGIVGIENQLGPFTIEDLGFFASPSSFSSLIVCAATIQSRSTWNFVGMEPLLSKEHTERIAAKAMEVLSGAV